MKLCIMWYVIRLTTPDMETYIRLNKQIITNVDIGLRHTPPPRGHSTGLKTGATY